MWTDRDNGLCMPKERTEEHKIDGMWWKEAARAKAVV